MDSLVVPLIKDKSSTDVNCRDVHLKRNTTAYSMDTASQQHSRTEQSWSHRPREVVVPYHPQCRADRPALFEPRQCSQHDCFCVNVTTGAVLLGTLASPTEVGACLTALYSLLLAVRIPAAYHVHQASPTDDESDLRVKEQSPGPEYLRDKIHSGLETILSSVPGHQQVVNVTQLISLLPDFGGPEAEHIPDKELLGQSVGFNYYRVYFTSTGHKSIGGPMELLQHRLHEGYLPEIGQVDSKISRLKVVQAVVEDPSVLSNPGSTTIAKVLHSVTKMASTTLDDQHQSSNQSATHKTMALRSSRPLELGSPAAEPSLVVSHRKVGRGTRQLMSDDDAVVYQQLTGAVAVDPYRQENTDSMLYLPWSSQISWWNRLQQPGVIAGFVGSVVVIILLLILLILFCVYRLRKRDEGSYALDEPHKLPVANCSYARVPTREFYA